jgi:hypothetical protein
VAPVDHIHADDQAAAGLIELGAQRADPGFLDGQVGQDSSRARLSKVRWSYSRRSLLEQCPRRYYYEYFGANKQTARDEPLKADLRFLKGLRNRHLRTGEIVHLIIRTYLRKGQEGLEWSVERLSAWAQDIFDKDVRYSEAHPDGGSLPQEAFPPVLLREYHYRQPDSDSACREAKARMLSAIRTFVTGSGFSAFRRGGFMPDALVEKPIRMTEGFACQVEGKVDLAFLSDEKATVVDWKLGAEDSTGDNSLQLAAYGHWAIRHFKCDVGALHVCKAYLSSGSAVEYPLTEDLLRAASARIAQDAERTLALDGYGKRAIIDAFTPAPSEGLCALCPFQRVCEEGRAFLYA